MGVILNLIGAIRRIGSSSQRAALRRQDEYLSTKSVVARRVEIDSSDTEGTQAFVATIEPVPETVRAFDENELAAIKENAAQVSILSRRYLEKSFPKPTPEELDDIFNAWAHSTERHATSDEEIVQILGAAFGDHCTLALNMKWVIVTDPDGSAVAIQGITKDFRGYPFHSIWKRIRANEQDFFVPVFASLQKQSAASREAANDA
jgi:hypothetical protein